MNIKVFISHATQNIDVVDKEIIPILQEAGIDCWCSNRDILPTDKWEAEIRQGIKQCKWFLVVLSRESTKSEWVHAEVTLAFADKTKKIIPVVIDDCVPEECHIRLSTIQYIDWYRKKNKAKEQLKSIFFKEKEDLIEILRDIREQPDKQALPLLFKSLAHNDKGIRERAIQGLQKMGWQEVVTATADLGRTSDTATVAAILNALASLKADERTVNILARLSEVLSGDLKFRAIALVAKKRLSLQLDEVVQLFRDHHLPYVPEKVLGQGLFTSSYLARHQQSGQQVVIRVLRPECALDDDIRSQFIELTNRSMRYIHESLALTREVNHFLDHQLYYCIRDYINGVEFQKVLYSGKKFEPLQAVHILRQLLSALTPIHAQGDVHGGVKPANIFLIEENKIILGDPALSATLVQNTVHRLSYDYRYLAPEHFKSKAQLQPAADYYAIGCVAYELISGQPPFVSDNIFELANLHINKEVLPLSKKGADVGLSWDTLILKLLDKNPLNRPRSVPEVLRLLNEATDPLPDKEARSIQEKPLFPFGDRRGLVNDLTIFTLPSEQNINVDRTILHTNFLTSSKGSDTVDNTSGSNNGRLNPGKILKSRFVIEDIIGSGGMGTVYRARDLRKQEAQDSNPTIAIKVLSDEFKKHPESLIALQRESKQTQLLAHPNIVTVYDFDKDGDIVFMTMELLQGVPLSSFIKSIGDKKLAMSGKFALIEGMGLALAYAHSKNIVHSDFKPGNIFVEAGGTVKILDFGVARAGQYKNAEENELTVFDPGTLGALTSSYASLEMLYGEPPDFSDDIYALACISYELLTGKHPFDRSAANTASHHNLVPDRIQALSKRQWKGFLKGLAFKREDRTQSVKQFLQDILPTRPLSQRWRSFFSRF